MTRYIFISTAAMVLAIGSIVGLSHSQEPAAPVAVSSGQVKWNAKVQGAFVVSLASDLRGNIWAGTEDKGIWCYLSNANPEQDVADQDASTVGQWKQFTTKDGLGDDNAYAIACDKLGRIWVGHLNHGVSVYNGVKWQNYDVTDGPLGERVFDIATCPTDGDMWIATSAGLTRYSLKADAWLHYTRADGLPSDQANALAFDAGGNLYVGTQSDGMAMASPGEGYRTWRVAKGPEAMTLKPTGKGLPSSLINDVLVTKDGTVYAATDCGLAFSRDKGRSWTYLRGENWAVRVKFLSAASKAISEREAPTYTPIAPTWASAVPIELPGPLLLEDDVTRLAQDAAGVLWIGHHSGYEARRLESSSPFGSKVLFRSRHDGAVEEEGDSNVTAILSLPSLGTMVARYGGWRAGVRLISPTGPPAREKQSVAALSDTPALPSPATPPVLSEINNLLERLEKAHALAQRTAKNLEADNTKGRTTVIALDDDWRTQGDWLGRYGRYWACLSAMLSPRDYLWGAGPEKVEYLSRIDPHWKPADGLRYYISSLYTDNPKSLEIPSIYLDSRVRKGFTTWDKGRRQSEWDDHGEAYLMVRDGPHVYCTLTVPNGLFYLSLYDFNKGGHTRQGRYADYGLSIRAHPTTRPLPAIKDFAARPELARGRIRDFWGGVYKRFLVRGPTRLTVQVNRNYSYCTYLAAVMLDAVDEEPAPYFQTKEEWKEQKSRQEKERDALLNMDQKSAAWTNRFAPATQEAEGVERLMAELQRLQEIDPVGWAQQGRRFYAPLLRWHEKALADNGEPKVVPGLDAKPVADSGINAEKRNFYARLGTCYFQMGLYAHWEECQRRRGLETARQIEKALRWDGKSEDVGRGYQWVSDYIEKKGRGAK